MPKARIYCSATWAICAPFPHGATRSLLNLQATCSRQIASSMAAQLSVAAVRTNWPWGCGADSGTRTHNLERGRTALCQLSYARETGAPCRRDHARSLGYAPAAGNVTQRAEAAGDSCRHWQLRFGPSPPSRRFHTVIGKCVRQPSRRPIRTSSGARSWHPSAAGHACSGSCRTKRR